MPDAIVARRIRAYDLKRTSEDVLERTQRPATTRRVCIRCRASSSSVANPDEKLLRTDSPCPHCQGQVIEVRW